MTDFRSLWEQQHFDVGELAKAAGVHETTVLAMLRNQPVYERDAKRVLLALSHKTNQTYNLETIQVALITGKQGEDHARKE